MKEEKQKRKKSKAKPKAEVITVEEVPVLTAERVVMGKGVAALNKALYEQSIHEAERLCKLRRLIGSLEDELLTEDKIKDMNEEDKRRFLSNLKRDSQYSIGFLERMQHSSLQLLLMLDVYKQLMEQVSMEAEETQAAFKDMDRDKVTAVRQLLLDKLSKGNL